MIEGWLLDVHENEANTGMVAWVVDRHGVAHRCDVPWQPTLHVHATHEQLDRLEHWLMQPEIQLRFGIGDVRMTRARLDLEATGHVDVLELGLHTYQHLRGLAEHVEARGDFHRFKLYSVDAHLAQRFLNENNCIPFQRVRWSSSSPQSIEPLEDGTMDSGVYPPFHVVRMRFEQGSTRRFPRLTAPSRAFIWTALTSRDWHRFQPRSRLRSSVKILRPCRPCSWHFKTLLHPWILTS